MGANIFAGYLQPPKSVGEYLADYDKRDLTAMQLEGSRRQNALADLQAQQTRDQLSEAASTRNAIKAAYASGGTIQDTINRLFGSGVQGAIQHGQGVEKSMAELAKMKAETGKATAETGKTTADTEAKRFEMRLKQNEEAQRDILNKPSAEHAIADVQARMADGRLSPDVGGGILSQLQSLPDQGAYRQWQAQTLTRLMNAKDALEASMPKFKEVNDGKTTRFVDVNSLTNPAGPAPIAMQTTPGQDLESTTSTENNKRTVGATIRGQNMTDARQREKNQIDRDAAGKVEWKQDVDGNWVGLPKDVKTAGPVTPVSTTAPGKREVQAGHALDIIAEARKVIPQATGSYVGAGIDAAGRAVGASTEGALATAKLKALEGQLMMGQPRMEGPQSDKDVMLYRQMAGQIGDPTVPRAQKLAALDTIAGLYSKYTKQPAQPAKKATVSNW